MDAGDQALALDHLDLDAAEADVEAFLARVKHLVAGLDTAGGRADGGDDPGPHRGR